MHPSTDLGSRHKITILALCDVGLSAEKSHLHYLAGLPLEKLGEHSLFYTLSWSSQKIRRPVRSISATEIIAAGKEIVEEKMLAHTPYGT